MPHGETVRLLHFEGVNDNREAVYFATDKTSPASDLCPVGYEVTWDEEVSTDNFPASFPYDTLLERA